MNDFEASIGDTITIGLCLDAPVASFNWGVTDFRWEYETIGKTILQETDYKFMQAEEHDFEPILGDYSKEIWTFEAIEKGTTEIRMGYSRPWEGGEQGEWTYTMTVTVE